MKKIILGIMIIISCFIMTGCNTKTKEGNKEFGKYTGIYKLKNVEFKIAHYKNTLLITVNKNKTVYSSTSVVIDGTKFEDLDCKFELVKNGLKVTTKNKDIPNGTYKRIDEYSTKEIYKDYVGDISLLDKTNGEYERDGIKLYIVQTNEETLRVATATKEEGINIDLTKESDNHFSTDFFDDKYDLKIDGNKLELKLESKEEKSNTLTGTYTKKSKLNATKVIKVFSFDDYIEN